MPIDKRVGSAAQALADVEDGATVLISGFGGAGFPNVLIRALRERNLENLTLVVNSATHRYSLTHELIEAGQVRKVVCSAARGREGGLSAFEQLWKDGKIELECLPQGTFAEAIRAGGAGIPAFYRDYVLEPAITGDLALVRADTADVYGNLTFRFAQMNFSPAMATAARLTIAEVRAVEDAPIAHERVQVPGVFVDRIVRASE
jgi:3-oxoadipate CoA-transferase alpha subunit